MDPEPPSLFLVALQLDPTIIWGLLLLVVLLAFSAMISGAEVAFFSLTRTDLEEGLNRNGKTFSIIIRLLERPKKLLATILVANNFINIGIVILFAYIGENFFSGIGILWLRFLLEVVVVTFLILLFGEIIPKIYASRNKVKFSELMSIPLRVLDFLFSPISLPMRQFTLAIHAKLGKQKSNISV
ncbi:MAG: DUF21 domain-containing protein, partial [Flavobacteriaceae bacterium]|nr:DUF21 domain-containing protein [Flavobacteriaceae bacterium]